jgi:hypothetical protein
MNSLTLVIYLSDVLPSLVTFLRISSILFIIATAIAVLCGLCQKFETYGPHEDYILRWIAKKSWIVLLVFVLFGASCLIPGKQTILLMAGSEFGEEIVKSPEARELMMDIKEVIQSQLKDLKKD